MSVLSGKRLSAVVVAACITGLSGCNSESNSVAVPSPSPEQGTSPVQDTASVQPHGVPAARIIQDFQPSARGSLKCNLDTVSGHPGGSPVTLDKTTPAVFGGWEFGQGNADLGASVVLSSAAGSYAAAAEVGGSRPDVAQAFGEEDAANSGFNAIIDLNNLPAGEYSTWFTRGEGEAAMTCDLKTKIVVKA